MPHLLILCTANICRSPMADGLARDLLHKAGYSDWTVSSAGTWSLVGHKADEFSLQLLAERGIDLSGHRSQRVTRELLERADVVLVMTHDHKEAVQVEFPELADKVHLISEMVGQNYSIADPIGGSLEDFRYTFNELDQLLTKGLARIVELGGGA